MPQIVGPHDWGKDDNDTINVNVFQSKSNRQVIFNDDYLIATPFKT